MPSPKPSDDLIRQIVQQSQIDPVIRTQMKALTKELASVLQRADAQPNMAITVMLNIMGSIIGTQMDAADRAIWTQQFVEHLPAYVEAYRVREEDVMPIIFDEDSGNGIVTVDSQIRFGGFQQDGKTGPLMAHIFKLGDLHRWGNDPEYRPIPVCGTVVQARPNWMGMAVHGNLDVMCRGCLKAIDGSKQ